MLDLLNKNQNAEAILYEHQGLQLDAEGIT